MIVKFLYEYFCFYEFFVFVFRRVFKFFFYVVNLKKKKRICFFMDVIFFEDE